MGRRRDSTVKSLLEYLRLEHKDKKEGTPFDTSKFEEQNVQKTTGEFWFFHFWMTIYQGRKKVWKSVGASSDAGA